MSNRKPLPRVTPDNAPFWEACRRHRLELPYCGQCGKPHLPPSPVCPFCFSQRIEWRTASGRGTISSWTRVHKEWFAAFRDDLPYNVVQVELAEGPRLTSSIVGEERELRVGLAVEALYDDVAEDFTLLRFRVLA